MGKHVTDHRQRRAWPAAVQKLVDGLERHGDKMGKIVIHGRPMSAQEMIDALNVIIAIAGEVQRCEREWRGAVHARREAGRR